MQWGTTGSLSSWFLQTGGMHSNNYTEASGHPERHMEDTCAGLRALSAEGVQNRLPQDMPLGVTIILS